MVPGPQEPADFLTSASISLACLTLYSVGLHLLSLQQAFPCHSRLLCPLAILPEGSLCARPGSGLRWSYCPSQGSPGATGWGATCGFF